MPWDGSPRETCFQHLLCGSPSLRFHPQKLTSNPQGASWPCRWCGWGWGWLRCQHGHFVVLVSYTQWPRARLNSPVSQHMPRGVTQRRPQAQHLTIGCSHPSLPSPPLPSLALRKGLWLGVTLSLLLALWPGLAPGSETQLLHLAARPSWPLEPDESWSLRPQACSQPPTCHPACIHGLSGTGSWDRGALPCLHEPTLHLLPWPFHSHPVWGTSSRDCCPPKPPEQWGGWTQKQT